MKTVEEAMAEGVNYHGMDKTSHKVFCIATFEKLMKEWPGGSYLVMKNTPRANGDRLIMAIGYKYNSRKVF